MKGNYSDHYPPGAEEELARRERAQAKIEKREQELFTLFRDDPHELEISGADCVSEGAWRTEDVALGRSGEAIEAFRALWDSINAKRGYGWDVNPWVWVIEFEVIRANVDAVLADPERYGITGAA